jgi:hypothetical protein
MTNGFIEAINGLFQAAKRKARGYTRLDQSIRPPYQKVTASHRCTISVWRVSI